MDIWYVISKAMWMYLENLGQYLVMFWTRFDYVLGNLTSWIFSMLIRYLAFYWHGYVDVFGNLRIGYLVRF